MSVKKKDIFLFHGLKHLVVLFLLFLHVVSQINIKKKLKKKIKFYNFFFRCNTNCEKDRQIYKKQLFDAFLFLRQNDHDHIILILTTQTSQESLKRRTKKEQLFFEEIEKKLVILSNYCHYYWPPKKLHYRLVVLRGRDIKNKWKKTSYSQYEINKKTFVSVRTMAEVIFLSIIPRNYIFINY